VIGEISHYAQQAVWLATGVSPPGPLTGAVSPAVTMTPAEPGALGDEAGGTVPMTMPASMAALSPNDTFGTSRATAAARPPLRPAR
jgi:hypothetical protein